MTELHSHDALSYSLLMAGHTRLLRLNGDHLSRDVGRLESVHLDTAPPYYCISHSWGSQPQDIGLLVEDQIAYVSADLAIGIDRLRALANQVTALVPPLKYLWIDTICINQRDVKERKLQVKLIEKIYSRSLRTIIWLGPEVNSCSTAWQLVGLIYEHFRSQCPAATTLVDIPLKVYSEKSHIRSNLPPWDNELWSHLRQLMRIGWFTRTWVIQEVALSRDDPILLHGKSLYPWHRLGWVAGWMRRSGYIRLPQIPEAIRNVDTMCNIQRSQKKWPLDTLLTITQIKFHATDQRDKIYGLLGLTEEYQDPTNAPDVLQPDYDIDVTQLYQRVGRFLLAKNRSLAILTRAHGTDRQLVARQRLYDLATLPSWLPDWGDFRLFDREIHKSLSWVHYSNGPESPRLGFSHHYNASGQESQLTIEDTQDSSILRVSAIQVEHVTQSVFCNENVVGAEEFKRNFPSTMARIISAACALWVSMDMRSWTEQFVKATTAEQHQLYGLSWEQSLKNGASYLQSFLLDWGLVHSNPSLATMELDVIRLLEQLAIDGEPEEYLSLACNYCFNRSFMITSEDHIGIGPSDTATGDLIVLIQGGGVPYLLRKSEGQVLFVGDAYIAGLMNGQIFEKLNKDAVEAELFDIR